MTRPSPPDPSVPAGTIRNTSLPVDEILTAVQATDIGIVPRIDTTGFGGEFLSEFIAYHGTWYHDLNNDPNSPFYNVAAGHIHVGRGIPADRGRIATEVTLRTLITHVDRVLNIPEPAGLAWLVAMVLGLAHRRR